MVAAHVRRGLAAGLLGGVLAALFAFAVGQPQMDAAIAWEAAMAQEVVGREALAGDVQHAEETFSRTVQKAGMVGGLLLAGLAVGALFGMAAAWAVGRVSGDGWQRSLKLGAAAVGALVLLPALAYPPNPPGAGDPNAVAARGAWYLALAGYGLLVAFAAWAGARELSRSALPGPARQVLVAAGVAAGVTAALFVLPAGGDVGEYPAELLWSFRLSSIGTQALLLGGTALLFGLLSSRAPRPQSTAAARSS